MVSEPGQPSAAILELAFWEALKRCENDESIHAMDMPCFSHDGSSSLADGYLPDQLWEHMEAAIADLRAAAGG